LLINVIWFWGLGIGDWGLGPIPNPQSPIPNLLYLFFHLLVFLLRVCKIYNI